MSIHEIWWNGTVIFWCLLLWGPENVVHFDSANQVLLPNPYHSQFPTVFTTKTVSKTTRWDGMECVVVWCDVMRWDGMWCEVMWCDAMWWGVMWCDVMHCSSPLFCGFSFLFLFLSVIFLPVILPISVAFPSCFSSFPWLFLSASFSMAFPRCSSSFCYSSFLFLFLPTYCYSSFLWLFPLAFCDSSLLLSVTLPASFLFRFFSVTLPFYSSSFLRLFPLPFPSVALPFFPCCLCVPFLSVRLKVRNSEVSGLNFLWESRFDM